ncbi:MULTISPECIES: hypothetical protein [Ruegeria]|uniref:hypothetical protein n=1 Tax=Ruegeria TaxID=97050 RepID=UPI00147CB563|nr:hypothetical protein [Ruegeria atlantica]
MTFKLHLTVATALSLLLSPAAQALDLYQGAKPQAQSNTCQSYASVLALAAVQDPAFPIETFEELRTLEADFRQILESMDNANPYLHSNWPKAMEQLTGGVYTFELKYEPDLLQWMADVRQNTTLSNDLGNLIATATGGAINTVLTSVSSMNGSNYSSGHIVTVMGLHGTGIDSDTQLIAFNSAIKGQGGSVNQCAAGNQPGDMRYTAGVVETDNFLLRNFPNGMLVMQLKKK